MHITILYMQFPTLGVADSNSSLLQAGKLQKQVSSLQALGLSTAHRWRLLSMCVVSFEGTPFEVVLMGFPRQAQGLNAI